MLYACFMGMNPQGLHSTSFTLHGNSNNVNIKVTLKKCFTFISIVMQEIDVSIIKSKEKKVLKAYREARCKKVICY